MKEHNEQIKEEHEVRIKELKERMGERTAEREEELELRMEEHKARLQEHQARMEKDREVRIIEMKERHERTKEMHKERIEEHKARVKEHEQLREEHRAKMMEQREERRYKMKKGDSNKSFVYRFDMDSEVDLSPTIVLDGKIVDKDVIKVINPDDIATVNVFKGKTATEIYGDDGKNGVVKIVSKSNGSPRTIKLSRSDSNSFHQSHDNTNFWFGDSVDAVLYKITKESSNESLNRYKSLLKKQGIDAKFNKIKRNANNEITSIKISLKNNKGQASSATWKDTEPIPGINVGTVNGKLIASSSM
jgi:hypothetical protein